MKTNSFRLFFAAAVATILLCPSCSTVEKPTTQAAIPSAENLLPSDTLFLLTAPDCAALRAAMSQSPQGLLWNDPAMKPFHDKFMGKWNESFVAPLEHDLGVRLADFADLPQGQFTFAVTQNGWDGNGGDKTPGILLLLDAKDKSGLLKTNLDALQKKWADAGKPIRTETICGIKFSIVTLASNDVPPSLAGIFPKRQPVSELGKETEPVKPGEIVFGQFESLLIAGNSIEAIVPVATHLTGGTMPSLADNASFAADKLSQFRDSPLYYGWFNAKTFFTVLAQIPPPQPNPDAPSPMPQIPWDKILNASGLMGLKSASFSYRESHDGAQINLFLAAPESSRAGIFNIFAADSRDASAPVFVPADVVKFWRWRVDGQKGWATLQTMLADISPAALSSLNVAIDMANASAQQKDPDFDIRKNLIGNLGDDFIGYQKSPSGTALADLNNAPSLFLFAASNPDQAAVAIKNVAALMYGQQTAPEPRDFLGKKIYTVPLPNRSASVPARSLYFAASDGYVAIAKDSSILENYLRSGENPAEPLRETAGLADATQHVGGAGGGLFGYENQHDVMRTTFTALKAAADEAGGQNLPSVFPKNLRDWVDFSLLPDYDMVSKYFYFSVFAGSTTADGISFKAFAPRPPQLN
jgi:hypothetical protein